jgi:hypothetical protein
LIDTASAQQRISLKRFEEAKIEDLVRKGVISKKEGAERTAKIEQEIAQLTNENLAREIAKRKELTESIYKLQDAAMHDKEKQVSYLKEINSLNEQRIGLTKEVLNAQNDLAKSQFAVTTGALQNTINILDKALQVSNQLQTPGEKKATEMAAKRTAPEAQRQVIANIGQYTGMDVSSTKAIFQAKAKTEDQLNTEKGKELKSDQEFQKQQLELEILGNKIAADNMKLDAENLKIQARMLQINIERQKLDLKLAEDQAKEDGDDISLRIIKNEKAALKFGEKDVARTFDLADKKSEFADQRSAAVDQIGQSQRQALFNKQTAQTNEYNAQSFLGKQNQILSAGEAGISPNQLQNTTGNFITNPTISTPNNAAVSGLTDIAPAISRLSDAIDRLASSGGRPNLTVIGRDAPDTAGKVYNDVNKIRADGQRL